jgi:flagellar biosynthesis/type III secretory pathway M-ring protein FliF/YscJ
MFLKLILILFLVYFVVFRLLGFILRPFISLIFQNQQQRSDPFSNRNANQSRTGNSDLKIDHPPKDSSNKRREGYDGGEYVDYEEV